ncbi:hypothetical protein HAX54_015347 [Datura stramonium]|uniref:KNOX2 domain-containing protein n=1 Tax=Datura stramonium TaxID=4076 RepID=A0ABS8TSN4_DATST|nr:hypothetical protein [Datura stramonium]
MLPQVHPRFKFNTCSSATTTSQSGQIIEALVIARRQTARAPVAADVAQQRNSPTGKAACLVPAPAKISPQLQFGIVGGSVTSLKPVAIEADFYRGTCDVQASNDSRNIRGLDLGILVTISERSVFTNYVLLLCSFKEQLQQHVRVHAMEAVMACWEIEQSLQSLTGVSPGEGTGATMSDDEDEQVDSDANLFDGSLDCHDSMGWSF